MITKPARKIPRKYTNVSGEFQSIKNGGPVWYEGLLERSFMFLLEFDDEVSRYVGQPIKIPYLKTDGAKPRRSRYTPDLLIYPHEGLRTNAWPPRLVEVKGQLDLDKHSAEYAAKFSAARLVADERGWRFETVTDNQINGPRLENAEFLYTYLRAAGDLDMEERIVKWLAQWEEGKLGHYIHEALVSDTGDRDRFLTAFWRLVARKVIDVDWDVKIGMNSLFFA